MRSTIICVDDEKMILNILSDQLEGWFGNNYRIERALGGEEALELIEELIEEGAEISCVISDYIMPNMKGDEFLEKVRLIDDRIKKVMLTGYSSIDGIISAINRAGLYRYITKPWDSRDLMLTIVEAIKSYEQAKDTARVSANFQSLYQKYEKWYTELRLNYASALDTLIHILEVQEPSYKGHSKQISKYATALATKIGMRDEEIKILATSSMLYAIGRTIMKPDEKNLDDQSLLLKKQILCTEQVLSKMPDAERLLSGAKYQFEKFSGNGILGLEGTNIPLDARIISICVYFDMLKTKSPALDRDSIIKQLNSHKNVLFDPALVDSFIQVIIDRNL